MPVTKRKYAPLTRYARVVLPLMLFADMATAVASNLNFLNDTPMSYITKRDIESIKIALTGVLNKTKDGETSRWTNEGTGNSVKIDAAMTPESTSQDGARTCRQVSVVLSAKGQSMLLHPKFCGTGKTDWALQKR
jgi:hypothetical protein